MASTERLLDDLTHGEPGALDAVFEHFYHQLKVVAVSKMRQERVGHTLGPTGLLHETYLRLAVDVKRLAAPTRAALFGIAAEAMRRILIERARRRRLPREPLLVDEVIDGLESDGTDLLALDEALTVLEELNQGQAQAIKMQYVAGLQVQDIAEAMGVSKRTVEGRLRLARAWLLDKIKHS